MNKPKAVTSPSPHMRFDRKNALIGLIVFVVLVGGGLWYWAANRPKPEPAKVPQYTGQALIDEVNKRYGKHDYAGAIVLLKGQKSINETNTQLLLASAYATKGDYQDALTIYASMEKENKLDEAQSAAAAATAERAKQYQKAIDFYKKAKQRADPNATDQIEMYNYIIADLEKRL